MKGVYNAFGGGEDARVVRARGGIGRREGLRILWSNPCRFDPCRAHQILAWQDRDKGLGYVRSLKRMGLSPIPNTAKRQGTP
jgi:hypothetical protein